MVVVAVHSRTHRWLRVERRAPAVSVHQLESNKCNHDEEGSTTHSAGDYGRWR